MFLTFITGTSKRWWQKINVLIRSEQEIIPFIFVCWSANAAFFILFMLEC